MMCDQSLLALLRCPLCHGELSFAPMPSGAYGRGPFGTLRCGCGSYPVVDGIPIMMREPVGMFEHTSNAAQVAGVSRQRLVELIEARACDEALFECLAYPVIPELATRLLGWRLSRGSLAIRVARAQGKRRVLRELLVHRDASSATEIFRFFYRPQSPLDIAVGDYFALRFGQPRHLAAVCLLAQLPPGDKPLLDIACGCGHLDHYLTSRLDPMNVVGVDFNFFHVWIARHWIAPAGAFVCTNASEGLPFADDSFSATLCADAYHCIPERTRLNAEIRRCAPGRPGVITCAGNAGVMPNEGRECMPQGYLAEIGASDIRIWSESALLQCYLERRSPLAMAQEEACTLTRSKWLSFLWATPREARATSEEPYGWPHAVGVLGINPVYRRVTTSAGEVELRFEFPSIWYAYENHGMLAYHPRRVQLSRVQLENLRAQRFEPDVRELISQFVLLGLPRRFLPAEDSGASTDDLHARNGSMRHQDHARAKAH
jgi:uncharacterized protein YbaR (Trm112 family)